jgi:hypothetical protein
MWPPPGDAPGRRQFRGYRLAIIVGLHSGTKLLVGADDLRSAHPYSLFGERKRRNPRAISVQAGIASLRCDEGQSFNSRHCAERSDEAIHERARHAGWWIASPCQAGFAMTGRDQSAWNCHVSSLRAKGEAIQSGMLRVRCSGLLRYARNDGCSTRLTVPTEPIPLRMWVHLKSSSSGQPAAAGGTLQARPHTPGA